MEIVVIHKPIGVVLPEMMTAGIELTRKLLAKPGEFVPGGKLIGSYYARCEWVVVCIWEVPTVEALVPVLEQMKMLGWNTEVIPVEKSEVAVEKAAKLLEALRQ